MPAVRLLREVKMICEKCWADAYRRSYGTGKSQYECYLELLEERKDNPCPTEAQSNTASTRLETGAANADSQSNPAVSSG
jgi:hypothetical protein